METRDKIKKQLIGRDGYSETEAERIVSDLYELADITLGSYLAKKHRERANKWRYTPT